MQKFQEKCNTIITDIDEGIMTNLALAAGIGLGNNSLGKDSTPINLAVTAPSIAQTSINNIVKVVNGNPELKSVLDKAGGWKVVSPAVIVTLLCETGPECSSEERKHVWNIILNRTHNKNAFPGITTTTQAVLQGIGNTKLAKAFSFWGDSKNSNFKRVNDIKSLTLALSNSTFKKALTEAIKLQADTTDHLKGALLYQTISYHNKSPDRFSNKYWKANETSRDDSHVFYNMLPKQKK